MDKSVFRYDYFLIWSHGLEHLDEILGILRTEDKLEILEVESRSIEDTRTFVLGLYELDSVPLEWLHTKIDYLDQRDLKFVLVLARHFDPEEYYIQNERGRFKRSRYIHNLKERIRELFNPRLEGKRTLHNVIHASDHERQVDHALRLMGFSEGIERLYRRFGRSNWTGLPDPQTPHP